MINLDDPLNCILRDLFSFNFQIKREVKVPIKIMAAPEAREWRHIGRGRGSVRDPIVRFERSTDRKGGRPKDPACDKKYPVCDYKTGPLMGAPKDDASMEFNVLNNYPHITVKQSYRTFIVTTICDI